MVHLVRSRSNSKLIDSAPSDDARKHSDEIELIKFILTYISLASHFWDISKQGRPRSDAWLGSSLFAYRNFYSKQNKNEKSTPDTSKIGNGLVLLIRMDKSSRQMWVKKTVLLLLLLLLFFSITQSVKINMKKIRVCFRCLYLICLRETAYCSLTLFNDCSVLRAKLQNKC